MYIANVTDDSDNITDMSLSNCTFNENDIDIIVPTLLLKIPYGLSFFA